MPVLLLRDKLSRGRCHDEVDRVRWVEPGDGRAGHYQAPRAAVVRDVLHGRHIPSFLPVFGHVRMVQSICDSRKRHECRQGNGEERIDPCLAQGPSHGGDILRSDHGGSHGGGNVFWICCVSRTKRLRGICTSSGLCVAGTHTGRDICTHSPRNFNDTLPILLLKCIF